MDSETPENNPPPDPGQSLNPPATRTRVTREKVSQKIIDEINERHDRIVRSAADTARGIIELGELLTRVKSQMRHGKWLPFVERNFRFTARTATRYIKAYEQRYDPILGFDPTEFMARVWGNESKQLEEGKKGKSDVTSDLDDDETDDEDRDDLKQHGGPGFEPGFFPDKGKAGFYGFKNLVGHLEREFFGSADYTLKTKLDFINELISWLETIRKNLSTRDANPQK
jgi:Protein of unknown function (DUF3102)